MIHKKKIMLISGTSKGVGGRLAEAYLKKGFTVIGCSRSKVDFASGNYRHFALDISEEDDVKAMFERIEKDFGQLDVLVNNAGEASSDYVLLTSVKTVQKVLNSNFIGTFLLCREAVKLMKEKSCGRIVNISSIRVPLATIGTSIYGASKAAIEHFTKVLAKEVGAYGITVNNLGLSIVEELGMAKILNQKSTQATLDQTILKTKLKLNDVIDALDFFISDSSNSITGQTLYLGGV